MTRIAKQILVTGAAKRLGRHIVEQLSAAGHGVVIHANRSFADAQALAERLRASNPSTWSVAGDLAEPGGPQAVLDEARRMIGGPVSGLVNSASIFDFDDAAHPNPAIFLECMKTNLLAPAMLSAAFAQQTDIVGDACIVNLLDQKLWNLNPDFFSYTLAKAGLLAATDMAARAFAPRVRVNAVAPGLLAPSFDQTSAEFEAVASVNAMQRSIDPANVANAVEFLMSNSAITGETIRVDNGQRLIPTERDIMFSTRDRP